MRRRDFVGLLCGAALTLPKAARAQTPPPAVIGFLNGTTAQGYRRFLLAFHQGLGEAGFEEGRNVKFEYRWAEGEYERLPAMAADLVSRRVTMIAATSTPANAIAVAATKLVPMVFTTSSDPVELGLVSSLSHPGGNVTGVVTLNVEVAAKRLELLQDMVQTTGVFGALVNPSRPGAIQQSKTLKEAGRALGLEVRVFEANNEQEIDAAFAELAETGAKALIVTTDAFFFSRRTQLIQAVARLGIPTIFDRREFAEVGGLMSYGASVTEVYRLAGSYSGQILNGAKPADMPVQLSTKVDFVVNLKVARDLNLTVPPSLLALADDVIE